MKAIVSRNELLAAMLFASRDESRYVLNGVCIEIKPLNKPAIVATDGRRLVVIETLAEQSEEATENYSFELRSDLAKPLCALSKAIGGKLFPWLELDTKQGSERVLARIVGMDCFVEANKNGLVEGTFPEWRKALPPKRSTAKREPISDLGMNTEFMADFAKAAKILEAPAPVMQMGLVGKEQQIEVRIPGVENFYGLVMPYKVDESIEYQPEFVQIVKDLPKPTVASQDEPESEE